MRFVYRSKPIIPTKTAMTEMSEIDLDLCGALEILENGFELRKRKKNIIEKGLIKGNKVLNVVAVNMGNYYKIIHAGRFTSSKKFRKTI